MGVGGSVKRYEYFVQRPFNEDGLSELGAAGWLLTLIYLDAGFFVRELPAEYVVTGAGDVVAVDPTLREIKAQTREMKKQTRVMKRGGR